MVHMGKSNRPERLSQGHYLSIHYKIEGLVRLAEGRMFYLASSVYVKELHIMNALPYSFFQEIIEPETRKKNIHPEGVVGEKIPPQN